MRPIKGSVKCHANSIPAALSKLSCSPGWRCFSYLPPSYPPDPAGLEADRSALGQKQTCAVQQPMSALLSTATAKRFAKGHVRFTPESGHVQCTSSCLLCANSGHPGVYAKALARNDKTEPEPIVLRQQITTGGAIKDIPALLELLKMEAAQWPDPGTGEVSESDLFRRDQTLLEMWPEACRRTGVGRREFAAGVINLWKQGLGRAN